MSSCDKWHRLCALFFGSECLSAALHVCKLVGRALPTKDAVAVWEAAVFVNDLFVHLCIGKKAFQLALKTASAEYLVNRGLAFLEEVCKERETSVLLGRAFRVLKWLHGGSGGEGGYHVCKHLHDWVDLGSGEFVDKVLRQSERSRVVRKALWGAAKGVSGKLVEEYDCRNGSLQADREQQAHLSIRAELLAKTIVGDKLVGDGHEFFADAHVELAVLSSKPHCRQVLGNRCRFLQTFYTRLPEVP